MTITFKVTHKRKTCLTIEFVNDVQLGLCILVDGCRRFPVTDIAWIED